MAGIHLTTITISVHLDEHGQEILDLEHPDDTSIAYLLGILDLCRDVVLHPTNEARP